MTEVELNKLITTGENQTCEFKSSFNIETIESLVAFANSEGGSVLIGVNNKAEITGVDLHKETIQNWVNEIKGKTTPHLIPDLNSYVINAKDLVVLSIPEYPVKPVAVRGKYYKRIGNSNHLMDISEVVHLHLAAFNTSWDFYLNNHFGIGDISLDKVQLIIDRMNARGRNINDDPMTFLFKNNLVRGEQITNAALLLFTSLETVFTTIELGRFQTEIIIKDSLRTKSDILNQIDQVTDFVKKHINKEIVISGEAKNTERWQYPIAAIREIIANMIVHRDYSLSSDSVVKVFDDKIEFYNPGRLPDNISIEELLAFRYISVPRNKLIADLFKDLGIIEKYGSGIKRIVSTCNDYGLPAPHFENTSEGFMVTLYALKDKKFVTKVPDKVPDKVPNDITENQRDIIVLLSQNNKLSLSDLAQKIGMSKRKMSEDLSL